MDLVINSLPIFLVGVVVGVAAMAIFNKVRGGAANPATTKDAFDQYKADVAEHFTETGKKFQSMTNQYQELYEHLAVGAHTLLDNETANKMLAPPNKQTAPAKTTTQGNAASKADNPSAAKVDAQSQAKPQSNAGTANKNTSKATSKPTDKGANVQNTASKGASNTANKSAQNKK